MRVAFVLALLCGFLFCSHAQAQTGGSFLRLEHATVVSNGTQVLSVAAQDLAGHPLAGAAVTAVVRYGKSAVTYHLPRTNSDGQSSLSFRTPSSPASSTAVVNVVVTNGYVEIDLAGTFHLHLTGAAKRAVAALRLSTHLVPPIVMAPAPAYVVVNASTANGHVAPREHVSVTAAFKEGTVHQLGVGDQSGVVTIKLDTSRVRAKERVRVTSIATWDGSRGTSTAMLTVEPRRIASPQPTPAPSPVPTPTPTALPTSTIPPTPTATPVATPTGTVPSIAATPYPTPTPTWTPVPTWTPEPTWTPTPTPSPTPTPTGAPSPTPTATAQPTATSNPTPVTTATPSPACPGSQDGCVQAMFNIINQTRAQHNLPAYSLSSVQSNGTGPCVGSYGHSVAMAKSGTIWHIAPNDNPSGPQNPASFPNDLCVSHSAGGENVGAFASGNELTDLQSMHQEMMSEGYAPGCSGSHACNILSSQYVEVGIGIYESGGETWLTEDFIRP